MFCGNGAVDFEEAADIEPTVFNGREAEIADFSGVHFKIGTVVDSTYVGLEAYPFSTGWLSSRAPNDTLLSGLWFDSGFCVDFDAEIVREVLKSIIEKVA